MRIFPSGQVRTAQKKLDLEWNDTPGNPSSFWRDGYFHGANGQPQNPPDPVDTDKGKINVYAQEYITGYRAGLAWRRKNVTGGLAS
jgi:hypothetical protein